MRKRIWLEKFEVRDEDFQQEKFEQSEKQLFTDDQADETDSDVSKISSIFKQLKNLIMNRHNEYTDDIKDDLLLKTELAKDYSASTSNEIVMPPDFNDSLITYYEDEEKNQIGKIG